MNHRTNLLGYMSLSLRLRLVIACRNSPHLEDSGRDILEGFVRKTHDYVPHEKIFGERLIQSTVRRGETNFTKQALYHLS